MRRRKPPGATGRPWVRGGASEAPQGVGTGEVFTTLWSRLSRQSIAGHTSESAWSQRTQGGFGSGGAAVTPLSPAISRANTSA